MSIFGRRRAAHETAGDAPPPRQAAMRDDVAELPQATLALCARHRLHPTPVVYETVYTYLDGTNPELSQAVAAELANGPLLEHAVLRLHAEHVRDGAMAQKMNDIGAGLGLEVAQMAEVVDAGIEAGSTVKSELTRLTESLDRAASGRTLIDQAREIHGVGLRQLAVHVSLRETLQFTRRRLDALERDIARHMQEANTDHLSKLPNRRAIDARLKTMFARRHDATSPDCLVMVDIDHFKAINDAHGHDIGDSVIRMTAELLRGGAGAEGHAARWGGEEFALLFERTGLRAAERRAESIRQRLEAARWSRKRDGTPLGVVTASFGVAARRANDTPSSLAKRADAALYRAKSDGRNRCCVDTEV